MSDLGIKNTTEIHLVLKEIEAQGELLTREVNERRAEIDQLRLELETLKKMMEKIKPGFLQDYQNYYEEERQNYNPELRKSINLEKNTDRESA
jgi:hypothetical protein